MDNTNAETIPVLQKPGGVFEVHVNNIDGHALPMVQKAGHVFTVEQATEVDTRPYLAAVVNDRVPGAVAAAVGVLVTVSATRRGAACASRMRARQQ